MGITPDGKDYTGVDVEAPILTGIRDDNIMNTVIATKKAEKTSKGLPKLNTLKERINLDEEIKLIITEEFKAISLKTGYESTFDSAEAMKNAIKKGTHAKPGSAKAKAADKKAKADNKPKPKKGSTVRGSGIARQGVRKAKIR